MFFFPVANIRWGARWDFGSAWEFCRFFKNSPRYSYRSPIDAQFVKMVGKDNQLTNQMLAVCSNLRWNLCSISLDKTITCIYCLNISKDNCTAT